MQYAARVTCKLLKKLSKSSIITEAFRFCINFSGNIQGDSNGYPYKTCNDVFKIMLFFIPPGIYADGYIVFAFPFVRSYVHWFVR